MHEEATQTIPFTDADSEKPGHSADGHEHTVFNAGLIVVLLMIMVYMLFKAYKHKAGIVFGHEASLVCLVGLAVSAYA